jgi:hypothetical protein
MATEHAQSGKVAGMVNTAYELTINIVFVLNGLSPVQI